MTGSSGAAPVGSVTAATGFAASAPTAAAASGVAAITAPVAVAAEVFRKLRLLRLLGPMRCPFVNGAATVASAGRGVNRIESLLRAHLSCAPCIRFRIAPVTAREPQFASKGELPGARGSEEPHR